MRITLCVLLFFQFALSSSCQKYTIDNMPTTQIHFGEGGGITGAITEYCLLKNGQLFDKKHFTESFKSFKKVKKRKAKKCFKTLDKMEFEKIALDNPGDKYYFIAYETKDSKHRITWGGSKNDASPEVLTLYNSLKALSLN